MNALITGLSPETQWRAERPQARHGNARRLVSPTPAAIASQAGCSSPPEHPSPWLCVCRVSQLRHASPLRWTMPALPAIVAAASNQWALCNEVAASAELLPSAGSGGSGSGSLRGMAAAPRPPAPSPAEASLLMTLALGLISLAVWGCARRSTTQRQRRSAASSVLPRPRIGVTSHERLQDAKYLRQILEVELKGSSQQPQRSDAASASPPSADTTIATHPETCEPPAASSEQPQADAPP